MNDKTPRFPPGDSTPAAGLEFLAGGGEMGALMRAHDWTSTPLGPIESWPQSLKTATAILLRSPVPIVMLWGEDGVMIYNDAYSAFAGGRHPQLLGSKVREGWPEVADFNDNVMKVGLAGGTLAYKDQELTLFRHGRAEQVWMNLDYSPVLDESGKPAGVLAIVVETTERVLAGAALRESEARLRFTSGLDEALRASSDAPAAMLAAAEQLARRLDASRCAYADVDADSDRFFVRDDYTAPGVASSAGTYSLDLFGPRAAADMRAGRTLVVRDVAGELGPSEGRETFLSIGIGAIVCCPLVKEGRLVAMMAVHQDAPRDWRADEIALVETVVERCWAHVERVGAEARLRESEARLKLVQAAGGIGSFDYDLQKDDAICSPEYYQLFGLPYGSPINRETWPAAIHPDDRHKAMEALDRSIAERQPFDFEYRIIRADNGEVRWLSGRAAIIFDDKDQPWRYVGGNIDVTERRNAEERYRTLFEAIESGFCIVEVNLGGPDQPIDYRVVEANPAFYRQTGFPESVLGRWLREAAPALEEHWYEIYGRVAQTGEPERFEQGSDMLGRWFDVFAFPNGAPEERRVAILFNDISARRNAEESLRQLNETLERRVEERTAELKRTWRLSQDLLVVVDPDGTLVAVNAAWTALLGWETHELVGRAFTEITHPEDLPRALEVFASVFHQPLTAPYEYRLRHKDGDYRWIAWTAAFEEGRVFANGRNVTAEKQRAAEFATAERARRQADALYRAYFENTAEALFVMGVLPDGGFTVDDLNPAHQASIGFDLAEVRGKRIDEVLPPDLASAVSSYYRRVVDSGEVYQYRETFQIHGEPSYWDTVLVPVRDSEGNIVKLIGSSRDLTRHVILEEQLRQSQKMETVGQLTGGVAHDFNNLLQIVTGNLDILQRNLPEDAARLRRAAANAMTGATRAATLTQRLLAFSRRQPLDPKPISINRLVTDMSELLGRTLGETIEIETILSGGLWQVEVDPNQLESAILNLAINARDAMPEGGKLTIETANTHLDHAYAASNVGVSPGQYVVICISDTGSGMGGDTISRAFEPFFTTKEVGRGTGLGLSQVYGFVKQSDGHVKIYSEPGEGTTVKIYLPRLTREVSEAKSASEQLAPEGSGSETILVLEDDNDVRAYSVEVLRDLGYRVLEAQDGPSALGILEGRGAGVDLLFSDVVLPGGMTGAVVAEKARLLIPGLKVLFTTGYARNAIVHHGRLDPGVHLLTKPFTYNDLAGRVRDILDER